MNGGLSVGGALLSWPSQRRVLHHHPSHTGHPAHRRKRQCLSRLGHSHEGRGDGVGRPPRYSALCRHTGGRAAGGDGVCRRHCANLGFGERKLNVGPDAS